ncbi:MAG: NADH-quinone oxidoreductase subunit NuoE [Candidatus Krumholzibacteriia bacterium]
MVLLTERDRIRHSLAELAERYGRERSSLLPILQEIQRQHYHISEYAMQVVADLLGIHPVEVFSVVSFYSFLDFKPKGRFIIRVCRTMCCHMQGKDRVARQLETDLGIKFGETTPDGRFTLEWANCIGMCDLGPALLVNDHVYTQVTPNEVHHIIEECRKVFGVHALQNQEV